MPTKPEVDLSKPVRPGSTGSGEGRLVLDVEDLSVHFGLQGNALSRLVGLGARSVKAVDGVSLRLARGEVLGLVGESGSGKTTLGRALLGLVPATSGTIAYTGADGAVAEVQRMRGAQLRRLRTDLQMVFQDPHAALNPSMTIEAAIGHPLKIHGVVRGAAERRARVIESLERVGLAPAEQYLGKYPRDLSGGQKQRAVIARAIILGPEVLVADEPVSMLDMSVRAKILQLMLDLKSDLGLTYVYITHDLASAKFFCDRIAIMYLGRIVEIGPTAEIFAHPRHPYTKALLAAIPDPDPNRMVVRELPRGEIPDAAEPPRGCSFHPRCAVATAECGWEARDLRAAVEAHWTGLAPEEFEAQAAVLGSLEDLSTPSESVSIGRGSAAEADRALEVLESIRDAQPDEPLWQGVREMVVDGSAVRVDFAPAQDPKLRRDGDVDVACVLFGDAAR